MNSNLIKNTFLKKANIYSEIKAFNLSNVFPYRIFTDHVVDKKLMCASELPYFEGDFWPNILENEISKLDRNIQSNICLTMEKMESSSMTIE